MKHFKKQIMPKFLTIIALIFVSVWAEKTICAEPGTPNDWNIELILFAEGLDNPVDIVHAFDGRLFILEKAGYIRIARPDGSLESTPFLDISDRVTSTASEQGLLGLAFHPEYSENGYFYVNYTDLEGDTAVSRFEVDDNDPDQADPGSETLILGISQPFDNHNGGDLAFGPDGYLYISTGDGGSGGDPGNRSQNLEDLLGKILRIDVDGTAPYGIPPDNPFIDDPAALDEIWAWGLRNPWRFSFDRDTDDFFIADVGQSNWEEINYQPADSQGGENYGWRCYEGNHEFNTNGCASPDEYVFPIFEYDHGSGCSVTGGYVYRGYLYPELNGAYFLADHCSGEFWALAPDGQGGWSETSLGIVQSGITSFGEDQNGELYIASYFEGKIYRIKQADADSDLKLNISLNQSMYEKGDRFLLNLQLINYEEPLNAQLYLFLDPGTGNEFFFWPSWCRYPDCVDFETVNLPQNSFESNDLLDFTWPADAGSAQGFFFYAGLVDPEAMELIVMDSVDFSYR